MLEVDDVDLRPRGRIDVDIELSNQRDDGTHGFVIRHHDEGVGPLICDDLLDVLSL